MMPPWARSSCPGRSTRSAGITGGLDDGGRAALGGAEAVPQPPYVRPTILVEVPEGSAAVRETFGPVLVVNRVGDAEEGLARANALPYGLGGSVFARRRGLELARRMRSGMTAVNSVLSFAAMPSLPYGGVGAYRLRPDGRRRWAARVRPVQGDHDPPGAVAAAGLVVCAGSDATARRVMAVLRWAASRTLAAAPAAKLAVSETRGSLWIVAAILVQ